MRCRGGKRAGGERWVEVRVGRVAETSLVLCILDGGIANHELIQFPITPTDLDRGFMGDEDLVWLVSLKLRWPNPYNLVPGASSQKVLLRC